MRNAEDQLASIGFGRNRGEPVCWRAVRLDSPAFAPRPPQNAPEPAFSRRLMGWRILLARDPRPSPYRISRVEG